MASWDKYPDPPFDDGDVVDNGDYLAECEELWNKTICRKAVILLAKSAEGAEKNVVIRIPPELRYSRVEFMFEEWSSDRSAGELDAVEAFYDVIDELGGNTVIEEQIMLYSMEYNDTD